MCCLQGCPTFGTALGVLARLRHRHLAVLLGVCQEGDHLMAVHQLNQHGSLEGMLDGTAPAATHFTWAARLGLAQGLARALAYLHQVDLLCSCCISLPVACFIAVCWAHDLLEGALPRYSGTACCCKSRCAEVEPKPSPKAIS